jgi:anti-anti-sigma regulatory factor
MARTFTAADLAIFDLLQAPVWVVDLDRGAQWWGNLACLPVWQATDRAQMLANSATNSPSETSRTRLEALRRRFERGETSLDRWTLYPDGGAPFVAECRSSGILVADEPGAPGRLAMLVEARVLGSQETDPHDRRGVEALRYLGELVALHAGSGEGLMRNPAAIRVFGDPGPGDQLAACLGGPATATQARACLGTGAVFRADVRIDTPTGERWFDTVVRASLDPVTGQPAVLVTQRDVTERRAQLRELEHSRELLAGQAHELRVLAAPVIRIGPGVLAMPLIGRLDRARLEVALAALVAAVGDRAGHVVLDLTGADVADAAGLAGLVDVVRVLRLRGVRVALSGIRPALAGAIVDAGLELTGLACFATVADALASIDRR